MITAGIEGLEIHELGLPRLIADGMVLQHGKKIHIWGWNEPGRRLTLVFHEKEYVTAADEKGEWEFWLDEQKPGGPYRMLIQDEAGSEKILEDILVGDVFVCSGQSNMDIPMERVKDRYPEEITDCENPAIRTFKIMEHGEFHGPLKNHVSGQWWRAGAEHILDFSATAYFFAKHLYQMTGVPVGLIHASLGGSRIESWLSREMIEQECPYSEVENFIWDEKSGQEAAEGYQTCHQSWLELIERYSSDEFVAGQLRRNEEQNRRWHEELDRQDTGLREHWEQEKLWDDDWDRLQLPCIFRDTELKGFVGSLWLRRNFTVSQELVQSGFTAQEKMLWLGTLVDSDTVYVNGKQVGQTYYQYPPRKYPIPAGLLHSGENQITIRLKCETGNGRITPGKDYKIFDGVYPGRKTATCQDAGTGQEISLVGEWKYRIGATCEPVRETDFVNWKPTALYNGMMAPNHPYTIGGMIWYQGEANVHEPASYLDSMKRLIGGYRKQWRESELPFYYVQLPNFLIDQPPCGSGWREVRQQQYLARQIPHVGMAVAIDLGEDNDLHPLNKEDVGKRLALLAAADLYEKALVSSGPEPQQIVAERVPVQGKIKNIAGQTGEEGGSDTEWRITITCRNAEGLYAYSADKGKEITDFELADSHGKRYFASAEIVKNQIILHCGVAKSEVAEVCYCYRDTNLGALIYNGAGLPMAPFTEKIPK